MDAEHGMIILKERETVGSRARRQLTDASMPVHEQVRRDIAQRIQDEIALSESVMRDRQIRLLEPGLSMHQQIEIDASGSPTHDGRRTTLRRFGALEHVEQLAWTQGRQQARRRVDELRLILRAERSRAIQPERAIKRQCDSRDSASNAARTWTTGSSKLLPIAT